MQYMALEVFESDFQTNEAPNSVQFFMDYDLE